MIDKAKSAGDGLAFRNDMVGQVEPDFRDVLHDSHKGFFALLPGLFSVQREIVDPPRLAPGRSRATDAPEAGRSQKAA